MMRKWSFQDAKNNFNRVVANAVQGKPQRVTVEANKAVVVISAEQYEQLIRTRSANAPSFVEFLLAMPEGESLERMKVTPRTF